MNDGSSLDRGTHGWDDSLLEPVLAVSVDRPNESGTPFQNDSPELYGAPRHEGSPS
jgi:hypothetical protein